MDAPVAHSWFLRKNEDGNIFGPLSFEQLARWASSAQVAPQDVLSSDQVTWIKAPMLVELGMDWLVELTSERYYGPTTLGAVQEFMRLGEINEQTFLINSCDGVRRQIGEMSLMLQTQPAPVDAVAPAEETPFAAPAASGMSIDVQDRIRDLEQSLLEERRALREAEERYRALELKYQELSQRP
jgi:hypothetical protein